MLYWLLACARSEGVITPPCHGGDRRFKSGRARQEIILLFRANKNNSLAKSCFYLSYILFLGEAFLYKIPVHNIPPRLHIVIALVFVVKIIRMFPNI